MTDSPTLLAACHALLSTRWSRLEQTAEFGEIPDALPESMTAICAAIRASLTSSTKSYHYVLLTQILAKAADPSLDARSLQKAWGVDGAFDARTVAHSVVVPFDQANQNVLGGSPEPYVNNPLRCPAVSAQYRAQQRNQTDWDNLMLVLDAAQSSDDPGFVLNLLDQVLIEVYRLLATVTVSYPVPNRISLDSTRGLIAAYLTARSGGDRLEVVCTALFRLVGREFALYDRVKRKSINSPDVQAGQVADIECWQGERLVLLVEVKDRILTLTHLGSTLEKARSLGITEILFIAEKGIDPSESARINSKSEDEFRSGQNVYVANLAEFSLAVLVLFGEDGRVALLREIGAELDRGKSAIQHRRAWAELLKTV